MASSSIIAGLTPKSEELKSEVRPHIKPASSEFKDSSYTPVPEQPLISCGKGSQRRAKTLRYSIAFPRDENAPEAKSIYVLEEYADSSGFDIHCKQQAVQDIITHVQSGGLADEPLTLMLGVDLGLSFCRPDIDSLLDPFVTVTETFLRPGTGGDALRALGPVFEAGKTESGTWGLSLYPQADDKDVLRAVGIYESEHDWANVHCKSPEVHAFREAIKGNVVKQKVHFLKPIFGFLYKSTA